MGSIPRRLLLDYLGETSLAAPFRKRTRNVLLRPGRIREIRERADAFNHSLYGWHQARRLEGREHVSDHEGIWPINCWRCERKLGMVGADLFTGDMTLADLTDEIASEAIQTRRLLYFRVPTTGDATRIIESGSEVRFATEISSDWYDPLSGRINVLDKRPAIGSHAVPLVRVNALEQRFEFPNSWGSGWGADGWGSIGFESYDNRVIEAWFGMGMGLFIPYETRTGIVALEWKWSLDDNIGVHCREIVDAANDERLAWAFCIKRGGFLDVEEFYVWPTQRGKGYGRALAGMVKGLSAAIGLPIRLLVSYADTEPTNLENLAAAERLLDVQLVDSDQRWVHKIGLKNPATFNRTLARPQRPAFILEWLRPSDEAPRDEAIDYSVFFGTNRRPYEPHDASFGFGSSRDTMLHTGVTQVRIPKSHRFGSKGSLWVRAWNWLIDNNPAVLDSKEFADEASLAEALKLVLPVFGNECHNLLFVHGFNVTFEAAAIQAAQFGVDLKIPGATFLYSWPSAGSLGGYSSDEATVEASLPFFDDFLRRILRTTSGAPLSIIVHSMGNRAVLRLLEAISSEQESLARGRIRHVIFAAPDVDSEVFLASARRSLGLPTRTTLYATRADLALQSSELMHGYSRAGLAPPVVTLSGMDTIMVEDFNLFDLGHGYNAGASAVLHDMFVLIHFNTKPDGRPKLEKATTVEGAGYWKLRL